MPSTSRQPVRYAVVGLGYIAQKAVLPAFAHAKRNSRLEAIVSGDDVKLAELGDQYQVPLRMRYEDYEECLRKVDAVFICTPNSEHLEFTVRAAHAGVHVLCEKPLAVTVEECERMVRTCREAGVKLMTAYRLHFEPLTLSVLDIVRRGDIGDPRYFTSAFSFHAKAGGIRTREDTGGGTVFDLGVYCINAARMVFGSDPRQVFARSAAGARVGLPEIDEMTAALMRFDDDRLAAFTTSFAAGAVSEYRIVGSEGSILMKPAFAYAKPLAYTMTIGEREVTRKGKKHDQFAAELLYFSECVRQDRDPEPSGEEGLRDVRIVNAIYQSADTGAPVDLPPLIPEPGPRRDQAIAQPPVREPELVRVDKPHD